MANPLDDFGPSEEDQLLTSRSDVDLDPFENDDAYREEDRDLGLTPRHEEFHRGIDGTLRREISDFNAYEQEAKTNPNKKHASCVICFIQFCICCSTRFAQQLDFLAKVLGIILALTSTCRALRG